MPGYKRVGRSRKKLRPKGSYLQSFTRPWKMLPDPASVIFNGRGILSHCKFDNVSPVSQDHSQREAIGPSAIGKSVFIPI